MNTFDERLGPQAPPGLPDGCIMDVDLTTSLCLKRGLAPRVPPRDRVRPACNAKPLSGDVEIGRDYGPIRVLEATVCSG